MGFLRLTACLLMLCAWAWTLPGHPPLTLGPPYAQAAHTKPSAVVPPMPAPAPAPAPPPLGVPPPAPALAPLGVPKPRNKIPSAWKPRSGKENLKSARRVGYFFGGITILLQVAVVVFLVIKRKQMIGLVSKYDNHPPSSPSAVT